MNTVQPGYLGDVFNNVSRIPMLCLIRRRETRNDTL